MVSFRLPEADESSQRSPSSNSQRQSLQQRQSCNGGEYDFSRIVCPSNNSSKQVDDAWSMKKFSCNDHYLDDFEDEEEEDDDEDRTYPQAIKNTSFTSAGGGSLANMDSLALQEEEIDDPDGSIILEHALPDVAGKNRRRRSRLLFLAFCLMIGVVVLTTVLSIHFDDSSISRNANVNDGSTVESSVSDNIFAGGDLPDSYYILEPKVQNASALLDYSTAEGKAFQSIVMQEDLLAYNSESGESAKEPDLIQRYALMTMYFGADGESWTNSNGWSEEAVEMCSQWHGVTCRNSVVTEINLDGNNLQGNIPADFCLLTFLESIVLSENPKILLPACISQLSFLERLYLNGNGYEGNLPNNLHQMQSLTHLELSDNAFTGSLRSLFPRNVNDQIGFPNLKTLSLSNNDLSGEIPESSLRRMRNLEMLSLSGNPKLSGSLNEICKGTMMIGDADCDKIPCRCCQTGPSCPSH